LKKSGERKVEYIFQTTYYFNHLKYKKIMNNNEPAAERYSINGFKYFSELAKEYFPDLANASSASKKMRKRIKANKTIGPSAPPTIATDALSFRVRPRAEAIGTVRKVPSSAHKASLLGKTVGSQTLPRY